MRFIKNLQNLIRFQQLPAQQRRLVFYSEGPNYWPHLESIVNALLQQNTHDVCYISSHLQDPGLSIEHPRLHPILTDEGAFRNWLFENMETELVVMTMPDLHRFQVKRSRHPVHYMYVQHSAVSLHMVYREGAFDHYDTICCAGPHHVAEMRAIEKARNLPPKILLEHGYSRLDALLAARPTEQPPKTANSPLHILVAPSWGPHGLLETNGANLIKALRKANYRVTLRPHPQTIKFAPKIINKLNKEYANDPLFTYENSVAGMKSLYECDLMISDWSGAALDFAFALQKPVLFIDGPRKINNPHYKQIPLIPLEEGIRTQIGAIISPDEINDIAKSIDTLIQNDHYKKFSANKPIYNIQSSHQAALQHINNILQQDYTI